MIQYRWHIEEYSGQVAFFAPLNEKGLLLRFYRLFATGVCLVCAAQIAWGDVALKEGKVDIVGLEALAGRWIALRAELAAERQAWARQERHWEREIALLEQEIAKRREALAEDTTFLRDVERDQADVLAEKEAATSALQELAIVVGQHEGRIRDFEALIPEGLRAELGRGFGALPEHDAAAERMGVLRRLQTVLALYTQIESLQHNMHFVRELIAYGEQQREVDVLYIGLSRGFAVSPKGDWAAIGIPTDGGWQWQEATDEASSIRLAIQVMQREADVQLVPLLLGVAEEGR